MKRHDRKVQFTFIMVLLALMITACGKNIDTALATVREEPRAESADEMKRYDFSAFTNVKINGIDLDWLTDEEISVLYGYL